MFSAVLTDCYFPEVAHAMYCLNAKYKASIDQVLGTIPTPHLATMHAYLRDQGYPDDDAILSDETHAYLLDGSLMGLRWNVAMPFHDVVVKAFLHHAPKPLGVNLLSPPEPDSD